MRDVELVQGRMKTGPPIRSSALLQAFNRCQLKHIVALWRILSAHKSELMLRQEKVSLASTCPPGPREPSVPFPGFHVSLILLSLQEPFGEIDSRYKADLNPENAKLLNTFLNHIGLEAFLLDLHDMMILKLKNPKATENFNPEWRYGLVGTQAQAHTLCLGRCTQHSSTSSNIFHKHENLHAELGFLMIYHYQLQESYILNTTSRSTMSERCAF